MPEFLITTIDELEEWMAGTERTVQITYRTHCKPPFLVRINRDPGTTNQPMQYAQCCADSLIEAIDGAFEAFHNDTEAANAGRHNKRTA